MGGIYRRALVQDAPQGYSKTGSKQWCYDYFWTWSCDNCGGEGGMTTQIPQCPECDHHRCLDCPLEIQKLRSYWMPIPESNTSSLVTHKDSYTSNAASKNGGLIPSSLRAFSPGKDSSSPTFSQPKSPVDGLPFKLEGRGSIAPFVSPADIFHPEPEILSSEINPGTPFSVSVRSQSSTRKSPAPSEIFSRMEDDSNSESELGSDSDNSEEDSSEDDESENDSNHALRILESHLFSILCYDLALTARVIPQFHENVLAQLRSNHAANTTPSHADTPTDGTSGATPAQGGLSTSSSTPASTSTNNGGQRQKRGRGSEESGDQQEDGSPKRPKPKPSKDPIRECDFACHFHKKDPQIYNPHVNRKYLHCICPAPSELRHLKDHFKAAHRPAQCDKCYTVFQTIEELVNHRRSEPCPQRSSSLREGIDDSQWDKIGRLLRIKRSTKSSGMAQQIEKRFAIWDLLFPDLDRPSHPWNENVYIRSPALPLDRGGLLSTFEVLIEHEIQEGRLQRNNEMNQIYFQALRRSLEPCVPNHAEEFGSSQFETNHFPNIPLPEPSNEREMDLAPAARSDRGGRATEGYQEVPFSISNTYPFLNGHSTDESGFSQVFHPMPSQTPTHPLRDNFFDTETTFNNSSGRQSHVHTPSPNDVRQNSTSSEGHYGQPGTNLGEQDSLEAFVDFNHTLSYDSMDSSSFNIAIGEQVSGPLKQFETDGYELELDVDIDNNSLAVPLNLENEMPEALAPWESKNDGNKFLWVPLGAR